MKPRPPAQSAHDIIAAEARRGDPRRDPTDPPAARAPLPTLTDIETRPWYRRAGEWVFDLHKGVMAMGAIVAVGTTVNVWVHGLVTTTELDASVKRSVGEAVREALTDEHTRLTNLETNTGGLPAWRGETTTTISKFEGRITAVEKTADRSTQRLDDMIGKRR